MKHILDMEVVHTYEGTYEVNMLVSGREITGGIAAFKWELKMKVKDIKIVSHLIMVEL